MRASWSMSRKRLSAKLPVKYCGKEGIKCANVLWDIALLRTINISFQLIPHEHNIDHILTTAESDF